MPGRDPVAGIDIDRPVYYDCDMIDTDSKQRIIDSARDLFFFLKNWLVDHIQGTDAQYVASLNEANVR